MNIKSIILSAAVIAAMTAPTFAAFYIPLGPKIITHHDPIVTENAPIVNITGGGYTGSGSSEPHIGNPNPTGKGWWNEKCRTIADVNDDCVVKSMNPGYGGMPIPEVTTITTVDPTITPVPDTCKQKAISNHGIGWHSC